MTQGLQKVLCRKYQGPLLGGTDGGRRTAMARAGASAHFAEHQGAVCVAQDQIDLAAARARAAGDPIIAPHQGQAALLQPGQRQVLGRRAGGTGAGAGNRAL